MEYLAFRSDYKDLPDLIALLIKHGCTALDTIDDYHRYKFLYLNLLTGKFFYTSPVAENPKVVFIIEDVESALIIIQLGGIDLLVQSLGVQP